MKKVISIFIMLATLALAACSTTTASSHQHDQQQCAAHQLRQRLIG